MQGSGFRVQGSGCKVQDPVQRKERIQRVRWHPDKNPILREFATEVTTLLRQKFDHFGS